jgi:hypothetical protein
MDGIKNYVTYDDKLRLAELMKNAPRDKLTQVVKLIKDSSYTEQPAMQDLGADKFQLKLD